MSEIVYLMFNQIKKGGLMKRVLFLLVSALMAGTAFASNLSKDVITKVAKNTVSISGQGQSLILEQPSSGQVQVNSHQSHRSHSSHRSHYSSRMT